MMAPEFPIMPLMDDTWHRILIDTPPGKVFGTCGRRCIGRGRDRDACGRDTSLSSWWKWFDSSILDIQFYNNLFQGGNF